MSIFIFILINAIYLFNTVTSKEVRAINGIYGGREVTTDSYPYLAFISESTKCRHIYCSGAILTNKYVLTAAKCMIGYNRRYGRVCAGGVTINSLGSYKIEKIYVHELFTDQRRDYDYALVKLLDGFQFDNKLNNISILNDQPREGFVCKIAGWGMKGAGENADLVMEEATLTISNQKICRENFFPMTDNMFCADGRKVSLCRGSYGGPLVCFNRIVGVATLGSAACTRADPVVFGATIVVREWILKIVSHGPKIVVSSNLIIFLLFFVIM